MKRCALLISMLLSMSAFAHADTHLGFEKQFANYEQLKQAYQASASPTGDDYMKLSAAYEAYLAAYDAYLTSYENTSTKHVKSTGGLCGRLPQDHYGFCSKPELDSGCCGQTFSPLSHVPTCMCGG